MMKATVDVEIACKILLPIEAVATFSHQNKSNMKIFLYILAVIAVCITIVVLEGHFGEVPSYLRVCFFIQSWLIFEGVTYLRKKV